MVPQIYMKDPISSQIFFNLQMHVNVTPTLKIQSKYQCKMLYFTIKYELLSQ